ncbi:vanillate O-demethylase oxygenase, iron-sulfur subunit [Arthrobacter crystallopoietes BAB-32]|uniref:Vanillate O-demethylase oxygenase, iron-sulfur subunit n=1 Tax=Arthrobacter crystallopoietes BAB-32 TaxID=1246476 RepID=N1UUA5_9MICC|nr:aromatic ring-hydroxylating dioxygenase subunit alpha [Arthrobacter crystallopoietes]EMY34011.1 vanillate O-demethylase oxygenase, iron-sulfur subunit [Arthrobacter crystallopoietes BAB-32]
MEMYVLNTWYVAAWSTEVTRKPIRRVICEQPIVLFRTQDNEAIALADRCAHRAFPLSEGRTIGDSVECGYHGFTYGPDGMCTKVPAQSTIPERARVRKYPVVEQDGWIWVWTGDPELANPADVPDTHWMVDPEWATVTHSYHFKCRADLIHDNLLDLTHESFLHKTTVGDDYIYEHGITVEVDGNVVSVDRLMPSVEAPPLYAETMDARGLFDRFHCTEFFVPNLHVLHSGITGEGKPREEGYLIKVLNGITPIDEHNSWYYYAFSRNFAVDNEKATEDLKVGLATVLDEDAAALEAQEIGMQTRPEGEFDVLIAQDGGVAKARRILNALLKKEQQARESTAPAVRREPVAPRTA